jgi:hypothetical protein
MTFKYHNLYKGHQHYNIAKRSTKEAVIFCLYCNNIVSIKEYAFHVYDLHFPLLPLLIPFPKLEFKRLLMKCKSFN